MHIHIIVTIALTVSLLSFAGCGQSRTSDYPDHSENTAKRVDEIRRYASNQKDAIDAEADRLSTKLDFDERQIRQEYKADRQEFINAAEKKAAERNARIHDIKVQARHDKAVIDAETTDKLKTSPQGKAAGIQIDAADRKAAIDREAADKLAEINGDFERSKAENIQQRLELDLEESREISALERERSKVRNETREKKLKVDQWTNDEMAKIGKDSRTASK